MNAADLKPAHEFYNPCGIYKITNIINNKVYIGSSIDIPKRWRVHKSYLWLKQHHNEHLQFAYNKYKSHNFIYSVLECCHSSLLTSREQIWIDFYDACNSENGYNVCPVAGSRLGTKASEKTKIKMKDAQLKRFSKAEERLKISVSLKGNTRRIGKVTSDKTKQLMSRNRKNKPKSLQHAIAISLAHIGKKKSPEHIAKIVASRKLYFKKLKEARNEH